MGKKSRIRSSAPRLAATNQFTAKAAPTTGEKTLYGTARWAKLVMQLKHERGDRCEDPTHEGSNVPGERRVIVDHIVELRDGGAEYSPENLRLLCLSCHGRKTNRERAKRIAAPLT